MTCDPDVHRRFEVRKIHDVAFVGNVFPGPRSELLERLKHRCLSTFIGRACFVDMARIDSAARLVFNRSIRNDITERCIES